jgi:hypothetical protein
VITGENNHDWPWTSREIASTLRETGRFEVEIVEQPAKWLADAPARLQRGELRLHDAVLDAPAAGVFVPPEARGIGWLPQDGLLFPHQALDPGPIAQSHGPGEGAGSQAISRQEVLPQGLARMGRRSGEVSVDVAACHPVLCV